jgi:hypothetical protein
MSFLNNLIKDPKYQNVEPRKPEEIGDSEIIISPDTRRDRRIPPGQSRTKKWPVLDAHGTPEVDLTTWSPMIMAGPQTFLSNTSLTKIRFSPGHTMARQFLPNTADQCD